MDSCEADNEGDGVLLADVLLLAIFKQLVGSEVNSRTSFEVVMLCYAMLVDHVELQASE